MRSIYDRGPSMSREELRVEIESLLIHLVPGDQRRGPDPSSLLRLQRAVDRIMGLIDRYAGR